MAQFKSLKGNIPSFVHVGRHCIRTSYRGQRRAGIAPRRPRGQGLHGRTCMQAMRQTRTYQRRLPREKLLPMPWETPRVKRMPGVLTGVSLIG